MIVGFIRVLRLLVGGGEAHSGGDAIACAKLLRLELAQSTGWPTRTTGSRRELAVIFLGVLEIVEGVRQSGKAMVLSGAASTRSGRKTVRVSFDGRWKKTRAVARWCSVMGETLGYCSHDDDGTVVCSDKDVLGPGAM